MNIFIVIQRNTGLDPIAIPAREDSVNQWFYIYVDLPFKRVYHNWSYRFDLAKSFYSFLLHTCGVYTIYHLK